jgi:hypothetical protein
MTWEWVALILGTVFLIATLFAWVAWTQMHARIVESYPKTLPDMMKLTKKEDDVAG